MDNLKQYIESKIRESLYLLGEVNHLRDACEKALLNGGKRLRPIIVMELAKTLDPVRDPWFAAFSVECFHTASLIADDLPCMDDELFRRNAPSLHRSHGESTALLASYALISLAYRCIYLAAEKCPHPENVCRLALLQASHNTSHAAAGQFLDLEHKTPNKEELEVLIQGKTGALYELSFVFAWIFGGGNTDALALVKKMAGHFGMAFQIADDFDDALEDLDRGCRSNLALVLGVDHAYRVFQKEIQGFREHAQLLGLGESCFRQLQDLMEKKSLLARGSLKEALAKQN